MPCNRLKSQNKSISVEKSIRWLLIAFLFLHTIGVSESDALSSDARTDGPDYPDHSLPIPYGNEIKHDGTIPAPRDVRVPANPEDCIDGHVNLEGGNPLNGAREASLACIDPKNAVVWEWQGQRSENTHFLVHYLRTWEARDRLCSEGDGPATPSKKCEEDYFLIGSMAQIMSGAVAPDCNGALRVRVAALTREQYPEELPRASEGGWVPDPPGDYFSRVSQWSDPYFIYGPPCPHQAQVKFTLRSLYVQNSRDVDGAEHACPDWLCGVDRTQETYGGINIYIKNRDGTTQNVATFRISNRSFTNGNYPLAEERLDICRLAQGVTPARWDCFVYPENYSEPSVILYVGDCDTVLASAELWDSDTTTGDDLWCSASGKLGPYPARGWGNINKNIHQHSPFSVSNWLTSPLDSVRCAIEIDAVGIRIFDR